MIPNLIIQTHQPGIESSSDRYENPLLTHAIDSPTCCWWTLRKTPQSWRNVPISGQNADNPQVPREGHPAGKHVCAAASPAGTGRNSTETKVQSTIFLSGDEGVKTGCLQAPTAPRFWLLENKKLCLIFQCQQSQSLSKQWEKGPCKPVLKKKISSLISYYCVLKF